MKFKLNYTLEDAYHKHSDCELVIYWNKHNDGRTVPGLYCKQYGIWIQWLTETLAQDLIDNENVEVVLEKPKKRSGHPVRWWDPKELGI